MPFVGSEGPIDALFACQMHFDLRGCKNEAIDGRVVGYRGFVFSDMELVEASRYPHIVLFLQAAFGLDFA